jgi:hypothetical protein
MDLMGRKIVDSAAAVLIGHFLLDQANAGNTPAHERKKRVARRFIESELPKVRMNCELVASGDTSAVAEYELLAGPVPAKD